ncbi:unnamed protein product, partial [Mesorhabditis belari]|uniref:Uncharacterized protein n=1 Tax=Mesorhabditis belari TaxID=2138241 RepID=A0AAF3EKB5_9BILA
MLKLAGLLFFFIEKCLSCVYIYPYEFLPSLPILGAELATGGMGNFNQGVCVAPQVYVGEIPTHMILDFAWYCSNDGSVPDLLDCDLTTSNVPFTVSKDKMSNFESCHTILNFDKLIWKMCSWNFTVNEFDLNWNPEISTKFGPSVAFLIRITEWTSELHEYQMMVVPEMMSTFEIQIVENDRPIWLTVLFLESGLRFLKNIQSNPPNPNCSYNFLVMGPAGNDADGDYPYYDPKTYLLNISESEPFVEQFLEVQFYSLEILAKCTPKIVLDTTDKKAPDWYEEKQELCDGTAVVTSQAYYDSDRTPDAAYTLNRNIFCNDEPIDVIVDLIGILDDVPLNITCYDSEKNTINFTQVRKDSTDGYIFWGISSIQFDWKWSTFCPYERFGMAVQKIYKS